MSDQKKHNNVSEKELDNLLNQAFLNLDFTNPKNEEIMETIAQQVMQPKAAYLNLINKSIFTKLIGLVVLISLSFAAYFAFFKKTDTNQTLITNSVKEPIIQPNLKPSEPEQSNLNTLLPAKKVETKEQATGLQSEQKTEESSNPISSEPINKVKNEYSYTGESKIKTDDTSYVFPKLTEKEIKETKKQKERMANWLLKQSKDKYALIVPKGSHSILSNISDTAAAFYIQNSEVTNFEYRTFLFDLLINGEKETFLKAKPYQYLWLNANENTNGEKMKDYYFSDKRYNDYPVVNISPEGAELYCKWLSNLSLPRYEKITARLPYENEWKKAANGKGNNAVYPWPGDSIQNRNGCHLANFCIKKQKEKLKANMKCVPKNTNAYNSAEFMLGDSMMTTKVYSYNPNDYGLFCMAGNVAEIVYDNKTKSVFTKGGSWNSDFEHCKTYNHEEFSDVIKANPMTGFRPIFRITQTHSFGAILRDIPETGLQQLTSEEITSAQKEKKKMIEFLIKFNKDKYSLIPMGSCIYKNDTISVQSFYMQTTEVTNLQYRTFLADLLIQKRNAEYLIAKPDQYMWIKKFVYAYNEPMTNMYFWHPAYDDYPVVNISRKGAEMYCEWLTIETNKVLKAENKPLINDVRIPVDIEWAYAASNKQYKARYANGNEFLRDSKGKYEVNYACATMKECRYDSTMKLYVPQSAKKSKDPDSTGYILIADGAFHTSYTKSYQPNKYGLYCMGGNVSEMVNTFDLKAKKINGKGTKGGNWFSCDYFLEIDANEEFPGEEGPSPLIGFRPVITFKKN